jgi:uncharacterized protein
MPLWIIVFLAVAAVAAALAALVPAMVFRLYTRLPRLKNWLTPAAHGLEYRDIEIPVADARLAAWFILPPDLRPGEVRPCVIVTHGIGANRSDIMNRCAAVARAGFAVLTFDWRAHGDSGGRQCSVGLLEVADLTTAIEFARELPEVDGKRIGLYGFSMGAAICLVTASRIDGWACVVADSPFSSLESIARHTLGRMRLPTSLIIPSMARRFRKTFGLDVHGMDVAAAVRALPAERVLLIGGRKDILVPHDHLLALHDASGGAAELFVTNLGHFDNASPAVLESVVIPFLRRHLAHGS